MLKELVIKTLEDKKANDIVVIDFDKTSSICDYFIVCDASNLRQVNALADDVIDKLAENGYGVKSVERSDNAEWILIDAYDVVVHIFLTSTRSHYNLEKLYRDYVQSV